MDRCLIASFRGCGKLGDVAHYFIGRLLWNYKSHYILGPLKTTYDKAKISLNSSGKAG